MVSFGRRRAPGPVRFARSPVRRPKNLQAGQAIPSATSAFDAKAPPVPTAILPDPQKSNRHVELRSGEPQSVPGESPLSCWIFVEGGRLCRISPHRRSGSKRLNWSGGSAGLNRTVSPAGDGDWVDGWTSLPHPGRCVETEAVAVHPVIPHVRKAWIRNGGCPFPTCLSRLASTVVPSSDFPRDPLPERPPIRSIRTRSRAVTRAPGST
jgi:hypothetical protein